MAGVKGIGASEKLDGRPDNFNLVCSLSELRLISALKSGTGLRVGIIHARWNTKIIDALVHGSKKSLLASGVKEENIVVESVPGSYELPFAVQRYAIPSDSFQLALAQGHN